MYKTQPGPDPQPRNTPVEWFVCMYKPAQGSDDAIDLLSNLTSNNIVRTTVGGYTVTMVFHNENRELRSQSVIYQPIRSSLQWSHPGVLSTTPQYFPGLTPGFHGQTGVEFGESETTREKLISLVIRVRRSTNQNTQNFVIFSYIRPGASPAFGRRRSL